MIVEPNCFKRSCVHFFGVLQSDTTEKTEVPYCKAFPEGIPGEISYGDNKHLEPVPGQKNNVVFEKT